MPAGTLPPSSFGVECPWRRGLQTFPLQSLQPARPRPAQAGHPGGSIHKSPRRKSGDSAWLRIPSTMQTGLAQWTGVPSLALRACMGVTRSRSRRRDGGDGAKTSPSLALRAWIGCHAKPEPTPGRRQRREIIPVACAPGWYSVSRKAGADAGTAATARKHPRRLRPGLLLEVTPSRSRRRDGGLGLDGQ